MISVLGATNDQESFLQQPDTVDPNYFLAVPWAAADLNVMFPGNKCALTC